MGMTIFILKNCYSKKLDAVFKDCFSSLRYTPVYKQDIPQLLEIYI